ncbi:hypothetical protein [Reichenbachiella agariperforans]|nr:hypothetical protein [Reichenbachiella agariperforans]
MNQPTIKGIAIICLYLFHVTIVIGQEEDLLGISNVVPPNPTVSALNKYGDFQVTESSGVPNIAIPLYEIKSTQLSLPISISYNSSGNRVEDKGSWVGLGWSLNAGGVISRTVVGTSDDGVGGFIPFGSWFQDIGNFQFKDSDYNNMSSSASNSFDSEPDIYHYNFNGYSGKFFIDLNGEVNVIAYEPISIIRTETGFEATTPLGIKYVFDEEEISTNIYKGERDYVSSWYLTSITSADQNDVITIAYDNVHELKYDINIARSYGYKSSYRHDVNHLDPGKSFVPMSNGNGFNKSVSQVKILQAKKISSISFSVGTVHFSMVENGTSVPRLESIQIKDTHGREIRNVTFDNSEYFSCSGKKCERWKLSSLISNGDVYNFEYDQTVFPKLDSYDKDHWGYFNNAGNRFSDVPKFITHGKQVLNSFGADRSVDPVAAQAGILKKIVYPTGGWTEFEFESNRYYYFDEPGANLYKMNLSKEFELRASGDNHMDLEHFSFSNEDFLPISRPDLLVDGTVVKGETYSVSDFVWPSTIRLDVEIGTIPSESYPDQPSSYHDILPSASLTDAFRLDNGDIQIKYDVSKQPEFHEGVFKTSYSAEFALANGGAGIERTLKLKTGVRAGNYVKAKLTLIPDFKADYPLVGDGHMFTGGLRISSISSYDQTGKKQSEKSFSYLNKEGKSSAKLLRGGWHHYEKYNAYRSEYAIGKNEAGCVPGGDNDEARYPFRLLLHNNPPSGIHGSASVMYQEVSKTEESSNEGEVNGRTKTLFSWVPDNDVGIFYPHPPILDRSHLRGMPKTIWYYETINDSTENLIRQEDYIYSNSPLFSSMYGLKVVPDREYHYNGETTTTNPDDSMFCSGYYFLNVNKFKWFKYQLTTSHKYLAEKHVYNYLNQDTLVQTSRYEYTDEDEKLQFLKREITEYPDRKLKKEFTFPFELVNNSHHQYFSRISDMVNSNIVSLPLEQRLFNHTGDSWQLVKSDMLEYTSNHVTKNWKLEVENPISEIDFLTIENSDSINPGYSIKPEVSLFYNGGKLTEYLTGAEEVNSFIWGYNDTYPIAKVENGFSGDVPLQLIEELKELSDQDNDRCEKGEGCNEDKLRIKLDKLRELNSLGGAFITTYTYDPLVGVTSITDPSGVTKHFVYDFNNRLQYVIDEDGNYLDGYEYFQLKSISNQP